MIPMHVQQYGLYYPWDSICCSFFCNIYQVSTCSCVFPFCCFDVFFPFFFKTCSKPRLKLILLRDRCRDEFPTIWSTELFIANNRSNKIGPCRTGIHVITVSNYRFGTSAGFLLAKALDGSLRKWLSLFRAKLVNQSYINSPGAAAWDCAWLMREHIGCLHSAETHFWGYLSWNCMILESKELQWLSRNSNSITRVFSGVNVTLQKMQNCSEEKR